MATANFYPTASGTNDWTLSGTLYLWDAWATSADSKSAYPSVVNDEAPRLAYVLSSNTKPSDLDANATITAVKIKLVDNATTRAGIARGGQFKGYHTISGNSVFSAAAASDVLGPAGEIDMTSAKSWSYTDFSGGAVFGFGIRSEANATGAADKFWSIDSIYLEVTYTPYVPPAPPTAAFTVNTTTGAVPLTGNFTDQSTGSSITSWSWAFGDTATSSTQHPSHIYSTVGTYTVTLTVANAGGTSSTTRASLMNATASVTTAAAAFTASPTSGIANLAVNFYDGSTGNPAVSSWAWSFGDTATSSSQNPLHTYTTAGTYTVTLTVSNTTPSSSTVTKTNYVTVSEGRPVPSFTVSTTTGAKPLEVAFTGTATNAEVVNWSWDFGDGGVSVAQNPIHFYTTVGTYTPTLSVANEVGIYSTTGFAVTGFTTTASQITAVYETVTASFTFEPASGYAPMVVRFKDLSSGDANSWKWSFGDGLTSTSQHPVHTYTTASLYSPSLVAGPLTATSTSTTIGNSTYTATNSLCVAALDNSWGQFLEELKYQLLEPTWEQTTISGFTAYGGLSQVLRVVWDRLKRFVLETQLLRKEATISPAANDQEDFTLPTDCIQLLRLEVDGVAYHSADEYQHDRDEVNDLSTYVLGDANTVNIPGTWGTTPTVKVWYTYLPAVPSTPGAACPAVWPYFPVPYVLWWIIRYGVMAELLSQAGDRNDPVRASACEEQFRNGIDIYKLLYCGFQREAKG